MSGLFDSLSSASRSLTAARLGIDLAGQNLANVNTEGYSRRTLELAEVPPIDAFSAGRGVEVVAIQAQRDELVLARLWNEQQGLQYDAALVDGLTEVEAAIGLPGASLDAYLTRLFDAFQTLADDPTSTTGRDDVVRQGQQLALAFHDLSSRLSAARAGADTAIGAAIEEVNALAERVALLNRHIAEGGSEVESLRDQRDLALAALSELAAMTVTRRTDGLVDVAIGSGRPLVVGTSAYAIAGEVTPPLGFSQVTSGDFDITSEIAGGRIGGLLQMRDVVVPGYQTSLDALAYEVSSAVNTLHQTGFDASGTAGGDFFAPIAGAAGAAALIAVDPAIAADSARVAASATGAVGDNQIARAIGALRDADVAAGGTATAIEAWGRLAYRVGADLGAARSATGVREQVKLQLEQLRAQVSGISMDEEAANLMRFQRAYEANARYFTTIVDTIDTLMGMVR